MFFYAIHVHDWSDPSDWADPKRPRPHNYHFRAYKTKKERQAAIETYTVQNVRYARATTRFDVVAHLGRDFRVGEDGRCLPLDEWERG